MDVFELRERVVEDYKAFVTSFMALKDPRVHEVVQKELAEGLLWPEPRIALNPAYADGGWLDYTPVPWALPDSWARGRQVVFAPERSQNRASGASPYP